MNIEELKGVLGDKFEPLKSYVDDLIGQRDAARDESINQRKTLKTEVATLKASQAALMERLGVDSLDDLDALPDSKGQAEAVKQFEAKMKRMERDLADKDAALSEVGGRYKASRLDAQLAKSLSAHAFIDTDLVGDYLKARTEWEDDTPMFKTDEGRLIPLSDGAALVAKTKPHLIKAAGAGGSGHIPSGHGSVKNPWAKDTRNLTEQARIMRETPQLAAQLKAAAGQ